MLYRTLLGKSRNLPFDKVGDIIQGWAARKKKDPIEPITNGDSANLALLHTVQ